MSTLVKGLIYGNIFAGILIIGTLVANIVLALPLEAYLITAFMALGLALMIFGTIKTHNIEKGE